MKKWEMESEEIEAVLEKIWDLHDKLSDAIHSISRTHFAKSQKNPDNFRHKNNFLDHNKSGFVFYKDYEKDSAIVEAKSLNSIRSALENLEDQLEFFHTVQLQQRSERDAALARLEQSRIILALKLAEHSGTRCKVIDEAMEFVGDVRYASCFVRPEHLSNPNTEHAIHQRGHSSNVLVRFLASGLHSAKQILQLDKMGGVLGNAALFALSMLALLHLHQVTCKDDDGLELGLKHDRSRNGRKPSRIDGSSSTGQISHLDVWLARG